MTFPNNNNDSTAAAADDDDDDDEIPAVVVPTAIAATTTAAVRGNIHNAGGSSNDKQLYPTTTAAAVAATATATTTTTTTSSRPKLQRGTMGRLSIMGDGMNFDIPSNQGQTEHVIQTHGATSWQLRILHIIHSKTMEYTLAILLFVDILLLFAELLLLSYFPHCTLVVRDAISCCAVAAVVDSSNSSSSSLDDDGGHDNTTTTTDESSHRMLFARLLESAVTNLTQHSSGEDDAHSDEHHEEICEYPSQVQSSELSYPAGCDEHRYSGVHIAEEVLFYSTIVILSIFLLELTCAMIALTPSIFFRQFFFALDYIIITVSLILEITFHVLSDTLYQSLSGMLVIFRIWRFVRIGHGIVELTNEAAHREYDKLVDYTRELRASIMQHNKNVTTSNGGNNGGNNGMIALPTNHPEIDLFFTNYDQMHQQQNATTNGNMSHHINDTTVEEGPTPTTSKL